MSTHGKLRRLVTIALAVMAILTFTACGPSFKYDKDAAVKKAEEIVDTINKRDYQAVNDMMTDDMKKLLPAEKLKEGCDATLDASGKFTEYSGAKTSGVTQNGVDYIVVVVSAKYDNATRIFTISLTTDLKIGGLYMK